MVNEEINLDLGAVSVNVYREGWAVSVNVYREG
jgi:hypothetical protein